ncbi:MAG: 2-oxoglutarate dehydrogenase complex dihydrolipoyllysine-residue succinyltransferase [Syntrophobacter sp.]
MILEVRVPEVGESVREALLAQWLRKDGERVRKDDILFVIETDKVTLEVSAPEDGVLKILVPENQTVSVGTVVGTLDTEMAGEKRESTPAPEPAPVAQPRQSAAEAPQPVGEGTPAPADRPPVPKPATVGSPEAVAVPGPLVSSSARSLAREKGVDLDEVAPTGPGGRITEGDVLLSLEQSGAGGGLGSSRISEPSRPPDAAEPTVRKPMSPIRQRIAQRLLEVRRNTAMLTTFNEIDMSSVREWRKRFGEEFSKKHGVRLGIMSFFIQACISALREIPEVNAMIDGNDIVYRNFYHIGVAIGAERGLVVPVIRNADRLGFPGLERAILEFVDKISRNRLELSDLEGGTFTITNGGVYGSLLSTPILNPPQSAILGMHKIEERPVAVGGQVVIRPMMYVALSYDHRIIDGRQAVGFLRRIKDCVENPERLMMEV